jgi:N-acetylmuramoyl-L-alanine amidase
MPLRALIGAIIIITALAGGARASAATAGHRVCLDPGHGGSDPGAVYAGLREADVALDIAQRLAQLLQSDGASVTLTRTADENPGNSERARRCNAAAADVVLSIHLNASTNASVDYARFFYGKPLKDKRFASVMDQSFRVTRPGSSELLPHAAITNFANGTLLKSEAPASLAETVFLSNPDEQVALQQSARRDEIAQQLFAGLAAWFA